MERCIRRLRRGWWYGDADSRLPALCEDVVDEAEVVETDERGEWTPSHTVGYLADKEQSSSQIERAGVSAESKSAVAKSSETCDQEIQLRQMEWTQRRRCDPNAPLVSYKRRGGYCTCLELLV